MDLQEVGWEALTWSI